MSHIYSSCSYVFGLYQLLRAISVAFEFSAMFTIYLRIVSVCL